MRKNIRIGELLIEDGLITSAQLEEALDKQKSQGNNKKLGDILIESGYIAEYDFIQVLSKRLKIPFINLKNYPISQSVINELSENLARKYQVIPIAKKGNLLTIATSDPMNLFAIEEIKSATKMQVTTVISTKQEIQNIIERCYSGQSALTAAEQMERQYSGREEINLLDSLNRTDIENTPVVKMINSIIAQGVKLGASDIHIEADTKVTRVRMRIDGKLQEQMRININTHEAIITRLKIMSHMDIAEKRVPQDGRFEMTIENSKVDLRISSMPTVNGEKMVIRILAVGEDIPMNKDELGFTAHNRELFEKLIKMPNGIILVTGPTGSGKSTTLYAILDELNQSTENIMTLEDPVEKRIKGINQIHINTKAGLTFASGLRSILRQDPDIIMVGEVRDTETASIAIRAAITGHLVFSSLHTNDAISTINRLIDMGIEPYLVSAAVRGVVAQRLTRRICERCKTEYVSSSEENELLGIRESISLYRGVGCQSCNFTGYKGRRAVHEVLIIDRPLRELINKRADTEEIKKYCKEKQMKFLRDNMRELVLQGKTTIEEFVRITYSLED